MATSRPLPIRLAAVLLCAFLGAADAQRRPVSIFARSQVVSRFDTDGDGRLDRGERDKAREALSGSQFARGRQRVLDMFGRGDAARPAPVDAAQRIRPDSVAPVRGSLYDPAVLRVLFLEFERDDWFDELTAFYRTDVDVPATLVVDGKTYPGVGVHFRGSSSYVMVQGSLKKPFGIAIDHTDRKARLRGYKTLNLLNGNQDPSLMRETIFAHVARRYIPAPKVNYVRLVINGDDWGVYQNAQQFNRDFLKDTFGTRGGVRWKVLRNQGGAGALTYRGRDPARYGAYELLTGSGDPEQDRAAWGRLIELCRVLEETAAKDLPRVLPPILNVDSVLWYCALENAFLPSDGYVNQGYDYRIYEDRAGRFHLVAHDSNEVLSVPEDPRLRSRALPLDASPLHNADNPQRPVLYRLLAVPEWRARYLAHLRTIATRWLSWEALGPVCHGFHDLIGEAVGRDGKRLSSRGAFADSLEQDRQGQRCLKSLVEERRRVILSHPVMQGPWPEVSALHHEIAWGEGRRLRVRVTVQGAATPTVLLHYGLGKGPRYAAVALHDDGAHDDGVAGDRIYGGSTPDLGGKQSVRFYVEARAATGTAFHPASAESDPRSVR